MWCVGVASRMFCRLFVCRARVGSFSRGEVSFGARRREFRSEMSAESERIGA